MNLFLTLFTQGLRTRLASWRTWVLLLLLPLLVSAAGRLLATSEVSTPVQVGVVLPQEGGEDFWASIQQRSGLVVTFYPAGYRQAERQVALGQWDCALILPEDFEERLARQDTYQLFTLLIGPGSTVYPMVRETVSACVAELISPGMAERYLLDSKITRPEEMIVLRSKLHKVLLDQDRVLVSMETLDGQPLDPLVLADSGVSNLLTGLIAIVLLVWTLLTAMDLGRWLESPFALRLTPLRGKIPLLLPRLAAALTPALCSGALALAAAGCAPLCIPTLVPYLLFLGAAALALALCRPLWTALPALMPFVPVLGLLLSPVLLDLSLLFPGLTPVIRWTPITLYLRACGGSWGDGLVLAAAGGMVLAALFAAEHTNA